MLKKEKLLKKFRNKIKLKGKCWDMRVMIEKEMQAMGQIH